REDYYDIQVGEAFIKAWKGFKTGVQSKMNEAAHNVQREIGHIFGFRSFEINVGPEDRAIQMIIDGRSFKLGEVGSGMTQFILVLANAAMKQASYVLLDEPELNLHPSL